MLLSTTKVTKKKLKLFNIAVDKFKTNRVVLKENPAKGQNTLIEQ